MEKRIVIEEGIYDIGTKKPLIRAVFEYKNSKITRNLFRLGDSDYRNNKIDTIKGFIVSIKDVEDLTPIELGNKLKLMLDNCFDNNVNNEIPAFKHPIITEHTHK